jgi:hypothetical protein
MPKEFYTEKDIEDMFKRGVMSLEAGDNVVLTELAYEKARSLGMKLVRDKPDNPPSAPIRPYISQAPRSQPVAPLKPPAAAAPVSTEGGPSGGRADGTGLHQRIREAAIARLGNQVDSSLLEVIIKRVLEATGAK